ncbi:SMC-Scp complex subunit ScpB [Priestia filamentosa]|uniref:SMC-Scp complex subunit ScpB n=1 Tax=Priestia filamentosa TaxID=1402861 RepID=UPI000C1FD549|nr:SMC-Scp complex subunit ScpB [Priestia filamentosa]MDT3764259.1 SMC-Scp complex subunit ScpB [Priestia filamentosa]WRU94641.1 SMC-Scp complex subunit ScpB [Priestia filamentosa]
MNFSCLQAKEEKLVKNEKWFSIIEALLFTVGDEKATLEQISAALELSLQETKECMEEFQTFYAQSERGMSVLEIAGGYQLATRKEYSEYIKRLISVPTHQSLSQAALETLAIIAYRQPITRLEVEDIRGVKTDRALQTLVAKALVKEVGRAEGAGRAILYGTTDDFLAHFGFKTLEELPPLPEEFYEEEVEKEADLFFEKMNE